MDNYIIRIYRRDPVDPQKLVGMAEIVETEEKKAFHSFDELGEILKAPPHRKRPKREKEDAK